LVLSFGGEAQGSSARTDGPLAADRLWVEMAYRLSSATPTKRGYSALVSSLAGK